MALATSTRHLLALRDMPLDRMLGLFETARACMPVVTGDAAPRSDLAGKIIANVFLENSTRTRCSFTAAAHRLGATTIDLLGGTSSASKGETLLDTCANVAAMGVDGLVIRCSDTCGPAAVAGALGLPVLNAGDGKHEHPTQGLLDAFTITEHLGRTDLAGLRVGICGDVATSRVARSNVFALTRLGADVTLMGPPTLAPDDMATLIDGLDMPGTVRVVHEFDPHLEQFNVLMVLRIQFERHGGGGVPDDYRLHWGLTADRAEHLPEDAIVMHPGPVNRGTELDDAVCDGPRSLILQQVTGGVAVRMASLLDCLGG